MMNILLLTVVLAAVISTVMCLSRTTVQIKIRKPVEITLTLGGSYGD